MTATAAMILRVRNMVNEPVSVAYSDLIIQGYIETYPLIDENGEQPYTWSSATPPVQVVNTSWVATYDLHAAAADIWEVKAGDWVSKYDFKADGADYSRSQAYQNMMARVRYHRSMRATRSMRGFKSPKEPYGNRQSWIGNLAEEDN